jgi:nucleotide-binding universal stress UspA family protein
VTEGQRAGTARTTSATLTSHEKDLSMNILLAIDGSPHSEAAIVDVARGSWPDGTAIRIVSVIPASVPLAIDPAIVMAAVYVEQIEERRRHPTMLVNAARDRIEGDAWGVQVTTTIVEGNPRDVILDEARDWGADLIVVGAGGYGSPRHKILGSVAGAVVANAPCSVQVVRHKQGLERFEAA